MSLGPLDGISALPRQTPESLLLSPLYEDTARRQLSTSQEEDSHQEPNQPAPLLWTSSSLMARNKYLSFKPPSLWCFVMAAPAGEDIPFCTQVVLLGVSWSYGFVHLHKSYTFTHNWLRAPRLSTLMTVLSPAPCAGEVSMGCLGDLPLGGSWVSWKMFMRISVTSGSRESPPALDWLGNMPTPC